MSFSLAILAFVGGVLTVLTPCFFTLLPVIIGGAAGGKRPTRPLIITLSLAISVFLFTLFVRFFFGLFPVSLNDWHAISGWLIVFIGVVYTFPGLWSAVNIKFNLTTWADKLLDSAGHRRDWLGPIFTGLALGPAFSSCSPTYGLLLVTVLPSSFAAGIVYILLYIFGLSLVLFLIAFWGRYFVQKMRWSVSPESLFRKFLGIVFVFVGLVIVFGLDKQLQIWWVQNVPFSFTQIEQKLLQEVQ